MISFVDTRDSDHVAQLIAWADLADAAGRPHGNELRVAAGRLAEAAARAEYAWKNARLIDAARQAEMQARTALEARCGRLENIVRGFLDLDDWHDAAIAPTELIERARAEVGANAELSGPRPLAAEGSRSNDGLGHEGG